MLAAAPGCDGSRDLRLRCVTPAEEQRVVEAPSVSHQVGRLGDDVLVSWLDAERGWTSRWFDLESREPAGPWTDMGRGTTMRPDWRPVEGALEAIVAADPSPLSAAKALGGTIGVDFAEKALCELPRRRSKRPFEATILVPSFT